ncbi:MAG: hypothetical protein RQ757_12710 [Pseudomonadales bacterium]|nr:hypothetical protein [Pseudomonadales bacterium]
MAQSITISRIALALLLCSLLQGCINLNKWPADIPERALFNAAYEQDIENQQVQSRDEYLTWVLRFYAGWGPMAMGWNDMTLAVMDGLEGELYQEAESKRDFLGLLISAEWAKDNNVRKINTAMLSLWGAVMISVPDATQRIAALDLLIADAQDLLDGELFADQVNDQRYQDRLGINLEP